MPLRLNSRIVTVTGRDGDIDLFAEWCDLKVPRAATADPASTSIRRSLRFCQSYGRSQDFVVTLC